MNKPLAPFTCTFSPNIPELMMQLNCTLAISTYQAGKVIFLSASSADDLVQLPRNFEKAMGIAVSGHKMAIATKDEVVILANSPVLAKSYPKNPNVYDALYLPRVTYYTGQLDIHDLHWGKEGLWAINTRFSCLALINEDYNFTPRWKPPFITKFTPEDYCHLNGIAMKDGKPEYVTALGSTNTPDGWRENKINGGILMDIASGETIMNGLAMPHSPRIYDGKLYMLLSATGELICADVKTGKYDVVKKLNGFVRGMAKHGDYLFVGLSKLRKKSSAFNDLPIAKESLFCGIMVIHLPQGSVVGYIKYETSVEELYDVQVLPNTRRPGVLNTSKGDHKLGLMTPTDNFWAVEQEEKENVVDNNE